MAIIGARQVGEIRSNLHRLEHLGSVGVDQVDRPRRAVSHPELTARIREHADGVAAYIDVGQDARDT